MEMTGHRCVSIYIETRLFIKAHFWNAPKSQICHMNHNPWLILCFRNLTCGKCTRSAVGSSSLRGTAFGNSTRTSSTDGFSEQLSLPFLTITRLFILVCLYLQLNLIPSALLCFVLLLFCYNLFEFWKWKKFERRKLCFLSLIFHDISVFYCMGHESKICQGYTPNFFLFNWGLLSYVCCVVTSWKQY